MKKKWIILVACFVMILGVVGFILWDNRTVSVVSLDINPSIKINLNKDEKVKSIVALNKDAKEIIDKSIKGESLSEALY